MEEAAPAPSSFHSPRIRPAAPVRVVARICPGSTGGGSFQVAARVVESSAVVSFLPLHEDRTPRSKAPATPRKDQDYRLDCCYPKDDDSCQQIFHAEVKPLVDAIFRGTNSCVVACGAVAKTQLITDRPAGLLTMAMEQILLLSQTIGAAVSVSSYEVLQDTHVFDLLEPKDKEVLVLEDAGGNTNLKGLSKVHIKSIHEFTDLCNNMLKHPSKPSSHLLQHRPGHHGFIIHISKFDQEGKECPFAKMNFLDLAAYIDPKERTHGGSNSNKSMYAIINVAKALNNNQSFIPYRESKLTRILQDSLRKTNSAVLIACLDEISSQDVVSTLSLVSRSCQIVNERYYNLSGSLLPSVHQPSSARDKHNKAPFNNSAVKGIRTPAANKRSKSANKSVTSLSTYMKQRSVKSVLSARKPFRLCTNLFKDDTTLTAPAEVTKDEELKSSFGIEVQGSIPVEELDETKRVSELVPRSMHELVSSSKKEEDYLLSDLHADHANVDETCSSNVADGFVDATQSFGKLSNGLTETTNSREIPSGIQELASNSMQQEVHSSGLHVNHSFTNLEEMCSSDVACVDKTPVSSTQSSPNVTHQLREISNALKLLSTKPMSVSKQKLDVLGVQNVHTDLHEPKTPTNELKFGHAEDAHELLRAHSTGIKKTMVKQCMMFLNSANKEQLKSLKGIGEKRANFILKLREESPEPLKEVDDLKKIIGMNNKEIKTLMSGMVMEL